MAREPTDERNLDGYYVPLIPWEKVRGLLDDGLAQITQPPDSGGPNRHTCWLANRPAGRPAARHAPRRALVHGVAYFNAGPQTQKAKNLARNPRPAAFSLFNHISPLLHLSQQEFPLVFTDLTNTRILLPLTPASSQVDSPSSLPFFQFL